MSEPVALAVVAFGVGIVIGLTGMGGGALMTPALIFFGIPPSAAISNDLVAAALNKSVGAAVHWRAGSPNLRLAGLLIVGSVPTAFAGAFIVDALGPPERQQELLRVAIGLTLMLTAATYCLRLYLELVRGLPASAGSTGSEVELRPLPTLAIGVVGGFLVGLTSVGSGSLMMVALLLIYPMMTASRLVGTDLVQAVPLVLAAAIGHIIATGVSWSILLPLILGGAPGSYLGARLANNVSQSVTRRGIVIVLVLTSLAMLNVPAVWVGIIGAAIILLGPVAWALLRKHHIASRERLPSDPEHT